MHRTQTQKPSSHSQPSRPFFAKGPCGQEAKPFFSESSPAQSIKVQLQRGEEHPQEVEEIQTKSADANLEALQQATDEPPLRPPEPPPNSGSLSIIPTKLTIGQATDPYEQEADRIATQIVQSSDSSTVNHPITRKKTKPKIQAKESAKKTPNVSSNLESRLKARKGSGQPLPESTQSFMESRFGHDFSQVRIHTDSESAQLNQSLNAQAFTHGQDILFGTGKYQPNSDEGKRLLAHELTHVVQQSSREQLQKSDLFSNGEISQPDTNAAVVYRKVDATFTLGNKLTITGDTSIGSGPYAIVVHRDDGEKIYGELIDAAGDPIGDIIEAQKSDLISATPFTVSNNPDVEETGSQSAENLAKDYLVPGVPNVDPQVASEYLKWPQFKKIGRVFARGKKLYPIASTKSTPIATLQQKSLVFVERVAGNGWLYVTTEGGISGYLVDVGFHQQSPKAVFINTISPADPAATIYKVKSGDTALGIAQKHYSAFVKPGHDARYFIGVIAWANGRGADKSKGIYHKEGKDVKNWETNWFSTSSWEKCAVVAERWIWIPSAHLAQQLENTITDGSLTNGLWSKVKDVAEIVAGGAAFIAGLVAGAVQSIWDLVTGLVDLGKILVKTIRSLITGSIVSDVKALVSSLSKVDIGDLIIKGFENLKKKWNGGSLIEKWYFRGKVIGYILAEVLMLFFSGGATAAKWAGKFGKLGAVLAKSAAVTRFTNKAQKIVDKGGDAVRYAQKALKDKRSGSITEVGKAAKRGTKLKGKTIAEKSIKLTKGEHKLHIQKIGNKVQVWICSDCGRMLNKIDDVLTQISSTGPTKSLHRRLTKLREKMVDVERRVTSKALPREHLHRELNQLGAHLRDLSTKYPDFDDLVFFRKFKAKKLEPFEKPLKIGVHTVLAQSKRGFKLVKGDDKLGWIHIKNGHVLGKPGKTMFPRGMTQNDVKKLIIEAVDKGKAVHSKQADKIKIVYQPKKFGVAEMEVWVNKTNKVIETAYPTRGTGVWTFRY